MGNSIATKHGDGGHTGLVGGIRVSKSSLRVETYGTVDELNSFLGLARSFCEDQEMRNTTKEIQKDLFKVGAALATASQSKEGAAVVTEEMVNRLTDEVHKIEAIEGVLSDWSISGEHVASAHYDVARTICRRAERTVVRLRESGEEVGPWVVPYLNRLSDLLWLFARLLEFRAGLNARLRDEQHKGPRWSRAWD
jgi:cob(I)alamin adenosyltransferase